MSGSLIHGPKPIVENGLVLHIDPANPVSAGSTQRVDPIEGVTDMSKEGKKYYHTTYVDTDTYKPAWENTSGGTIRLDTTSDSTSTFKYGYIDLGIPVVGITSFSTTDSYTFDFWWKQDTVTTSGADSYMVTGGTLYGPSNEYINTIDNNTEYNARESRSPMTISIVSDDSSTTSCKVRLTAKHEVYVGGSINKRKKYEVNGIGVSFNQWNHICGVFDLGDSLGNGAMAYLYINGSAASFEESITSGSAPYSFDQNGNSHIGASNMTYQSHTGSLRGNAAKGEMGPFKIYNRALTQTEVRQNYESLRHRYDLLPVGSTTVASGQQTFTSSEYWYVPEGVTSISAVCVGGGGGASRGYTLGGAGGGGGGLSWRNNISVTPGDSLWVFIGTGGGGNGNIPTANSAVGYADGEDGGNTSINNITADEMLLYAYGGEGGEYNASNSGGSGGLDSEYFGEGGNGGEGGIIYDDEGGGGDGGDGGDSEGEKAGGGGGAGGYAGKGGAGGTGGVNFGYGEDGAGGGGGGGSFSQDSTNHNGPGAGVGTIIQSTSGTGGSGGGDDSTTVLATGGSGGGSGSGGSFNSSGNGGNYGGGGGGCELGAGGDGAGGAARIIWGDYFTDSRSYPSNSQSA